MTTAHGSQRTRHRVRAQQHWEPRLLAESWTPNFVHKTVLGVQGHPGVLGTFCPYKDLEKYKELWPRELWMCGSAGIWPVRELSLQQVLASPSSVLTRWEELAMMAFISE